jgi:hypothetical protein
MPAVQQSSKCILCQAQEALVERVMVGRNEAPGSVLPCQTIGTLDRKVSGHDVARDLEYNWQCVHGSSSIVSIS